MCKQLKEGLQRNVISGAAHEEIHKEAEWKKKKASQAHYMIRKPANLKEKQLKKNRMNAEIKKER